MSWIPPTTNPIGNHQSYPHTFPPNYIHPQVNPSSQQAQQATPPSIGVPSPGGSQAPKWTEYTTPEGKKYYYDIVSKKSVWEKPAELLTSSQPPAPSEWKEYTADNGKKYYYNVVTKKTTWDAPPEFTNKPTTTQNMEQKPCAIPVNSATGMSPQPSPTNPALQTVTSAPNPASMVIPTTQQPFIPQPTRPPVRPPPAPSSYKNMTYVRSSASLLNPNHVFVDFSTKEEAEKAFLGLLSRTGVTSTWTWEQTLRAIVNNPLYSSLKTLPERKAAYSKYIEERREIEREERRTLIAKKKSDFQNLLLSRSDVTSETRWRKAQKLLSEEAAYKAIDNESVLRDIFQDYVNALSVKERERKRTLRRENTDKLENIFKSMPEIQFNTRWREAYELIKEHAQFKDNQDLQAMDKIDVLATYESYIKDLEKIHSDTLKAEKVTQRRAERKNRDQMRELLNELRQQNVINPRTKWKEVYPIISEKAFYDDMLGQPGSTPLELFWDIIEEIHDFCYTQRKLIEPFLKERDVAINQEADFTMFQSYVTADERFSSLTEHELVVIFEQLQLKAENKAKELQRKKEKKIRRKIDDLRHAIKHSEVPIGVTSTWEEVRDHIQDYPEFQALENEEDRKQAFDKYVKKLKSGKKSSKHKTKDRKRKHDASDDGEDDDHHNQDDRNSPSSKKRSRSKNYSSNSESEERVSSKSKSRKSKGSRKKPSSASPEGKESP